MALKKAVAPPAVEGINFGDLSMYVAGGGLPEGDYVMADLTVQMYQAKNQQGIAKGPERLGVMITFLPLHDPKPENGREQFYSMGSNADKSFAPNPNTGKGVVAIPGASGTTFNETTNWAIFLKSLYDSGLPQGIFTNDTSVLEGAHVHIANIPEPEDRKSFRNAAATGEAAAEQPNRPGTIAVVTEIKDDGKPWEGSGGIPEAAPATPARVNGKAPAAKPALVKAAPKAAPVPTPVESGVDQDTEAAAIEGISAFLEKNANGAPRMKVKVETFKHIKAAYGEEMAAQVQDAIMEKDDVLATVLGQLGYAIAGPMVKPAA